MSIPAPIVISFGLQGPAGVSGSVVAPLVLTGTTISLATDGTLHVVAGQLAVVYGAVAGTACAGDDARLSDTRTPTDGSVTNAKLASGAVAVGAGLTGDGRAAAPLVVSYGTAAGTATQGNDTRVVNAVQTSRQVLAGTGLTGGGALSGDVTLTVAYGTSTGTALQGSQDALYVHLAGTESLTGDKTFSGRLIAAADFARTLATTKTTTFNAVAGVSVYRVDTTSAAFTGTLALASTYPAGAHVRFMDVAGQCGANPLTVATSGGQTIDGAATDAIAVAYGWLEVTTDGTNWFVVSRGHAFSAATPAAATTAGSAGTAKTVARSDHAHPAPLFVGQASQQTTYAGSTLAVARRVTGGTDTPSLADSDVELNAQCTVTLDDALPDGTTMTFYDTTGAATASPHTLAPNNSKTINGGLTYSFNRSWGWQSVKKIRGNWTAAQ